ncbi:MAG: hypothetical protein KDD47_20535, partial [Acidobacteria bacterium]|nr:hypothetical protein [Acidobacteriota bacterium]
MTSGNRSPRRWQGILVLLALLGTSLAAEGKTRSGKKAGDEAAGPTPSAWLVLGPELMPLPAFHDSGTPSFGPEELLVQDWLDLGDLWPEAGQVVAWPDGREISWQQVAAPLRWQRDEATPSVALLA